MRILLIFLALGAFLHAQKIASVSNLVSEASSVSPGKTFTVALSLQHPDEWHSYYKNSGGIELPPTIEWNLPEGATAGEIQWPVPEIKEGYGGKSFVYPGSPAFLIEITPPSSLSPGDFFTLRADAKWQICKTSCINESATFTLEIPVTDAPQTDANQVEFFTAARRNIPFDAPESVVIKTESSADTVSLQISGITGDPVDFIPNEPYLKPLSDGGVFTRTADNITLTLQRKKTDFLDEPIPQGDTVSGILVGETSIRIDETRALPTPEKNAVETKPIPFGKLLPILWGMFLGGLILNLMPCVFPVIGLKIMGFVQQAGHNRRSIALHGVSFTLGVLASFAVLSGILFALRATVGWGYQLQNPWVVLVLMLLMFVLALNMFGLFELGTSATSVGGKLQGKTGHTGSFFSGVLATVVATPCSAPFLGAAIAAAIALPALQFFSAFAAMALGLATPYLILSLFPHLIEKLPRPGAWMESFKQAMSFLLFGTAAYLLWVYSGLIGQEYLLAPLLGLSLIATAAWIYGRWNLPHKPGKTRLTALVLTLVFVSSGIVLSLPPKPNELWQPWSSETVNRLLDEGTPVYIDFTAQWCVTCQVNKKVAYTQDVLALAKSKNIVFLKADKTKTDPAIDAKLQELGRSAIPVNVLMIPGEDPIITPEILTPGILTDLFNKVP